MNDRESILIVDDDDSTSRVLSLMFGKEGYETEMVNTGQDAIDMARSRFFNAALLDVRLPDREGIELIVPLKEIHPDMVVIMVTAYASMENVVRALNEGAAAYITKPFDIHEVSATVRQALEKQRLVMENRRLYEEAQRELAERRRTEEALRESEEKYKKLAESITDVFFAMDAELRYTYWNRASEELTGISAKDALGKHIYDLSPDSEEMKISEKVYREVLRTRQPHHFFNKYQVDGKEFFCEVSAYPTENGLSVFIKDITERRRLEKKMVEYEELSNLKTNLLSTVSHELRTPLATIKGYSTMLVDYDRRLKPREKLEHLRSIDRATDRLTDLVDHLLDMSRLDAGLLTLEKESINISELIEGTVSEAQFRAPHHKIRMEIRQRLLRVEVDARRIRQVLDNLIDNAVRYSDEGTEVVVSANQTDGELLISVADRGRGIPADELDRVFDRMYRIEQRLTQGAGGLGLGLSICKGLVGAHGGRIWMESEEKKGSRCSFTLPL